MVNQCQLLNGLFASGVQVALGLIAISTLAAKRICEKPRRPWRVWALDVAKQAAGGLFAHCLNLIAAEFLSASSTFHDQCVWYFLNFTLDTTVGVFLAWILLKGVERWAQRVRCVALQHSGDYNGVFRVDYGRWALQLLSWLCITLVVKAVLVSVIYGAHTLFVAIGDKISDLFGDHPHIELITVMIACPCAMNILQFWIQDTFLKHNKVGKGALKSGYRPSDDSSDPMLAPSEVDVDPPAASMVRSPLAMESSSDDGW